MGNVINLPNITPDSIVFNNESTNKGFSKTNAFNEKNYLNVRLDEQNGEKTKTLTIRLLPMDLETGNPFVRIHVHNVKVPKENLLGKEGEGRPVAKRPLVRKEGRRAKPVMVFQRPHQRMEQIGQDQAPDKGAEDADQRVQSLADNPDVIERHEKQNGAGDHAKGRDPPVEIFFIPFEFHIYASFYMLITNNSVLCSFK